MAKLHKSSKDPELYYYFNASDEKLWCYRHRYYDDDGKRREKSKQGIRTEKEALRALLEVKALTLRGASKQVEYDQITVSQWLDIWYETNKNTWRTSTRNHREQLIRIYAKPLLGHYKLQKLDKMTYKRMFIDHLLAKKLSINTVKLYHRLFNIAINEAVDNEILLRNRFNKIVIKDPASHIKNKAEENFLTVEELTHLISVTQSKADMTTYTLILLLAYTGLRRGEAYGLQWGNIDFDNKTLTVERTRDDGGGIRPPKTNNSYRTILIDDLLVQQLKKYKTWCKEVLFQFGKKLIDDTFIFISKQSGTPISNTALTYQLKKMVKLAKVNEITPHGFRHTHATILISNGVNVKVIADRLGNTPGMVMEIYSHSFKQLEAESVALFSESLKAIGGGSGGHS